MFGAGDRVIRVRSAEHNRDTIGHVATVVGQIGGSIEVVWDDLPSDRNGWYNADWFALSEDIGYDVDE